MSDRKRTREKEDRRDHKRHKTSKQDLEKLKTQTKRLNQDVQKLKHVETFYEKPPPGFIKEHQDKPEDCIPAEPGNEEARSFLAHAPTKGLWMPLGREVKVMQCWRCKRYGHRTGDRECPFFIKGNQKLEQFRVAHEDPMYDVIRENKRNEKETRIQQLQQLLQDTTSSNSDSSSSSSSSSSSDHHRSKKRKKRKDKKKKDKKKRKRKRKHKSSKTSDCSDSD
ncbi:retinitis pigmentosa 9 protein [Micropterus salmoides]|uniref:retinitis pigmentosa 9 protein n=1 Tax=Micropterus salmoides TaxID=27706 RepID=UPI0018EAFBE5|nr:retinitis pigmentosa 9 protein [Micropterus salmoides]XP_045915447.1 retinitis pigmentosa 9 protein [Micropterus dolomieu]